MKACLQDYRQAVYWATKARSAIYAVPHSLNAPAIKRIPPTAVHSRRAGIEKQRKRVMAKASVQFLAHKPSNGLSLIEDHNLALEWHSPQSRSVGIAAEAQDDRRMFMQWARLLLVTTNRRWRGIAAARRDCFAAQTHLGIIMFAFGRGAPRKATDGVIAWYLCASKQDFAKSATSAWRSI